MAEKKKKTEQNKRKTVKTASRSYKKSAPKKPANDKVREAEKKKEPIRKPNGLMGQLMPFFLGVAAVFIAVCLLVSGVGVIGSFIKNVLFGLFSGGAYILPLFLIVAAFMWHKDSENGMIPWKSVCFCVSFVIVVILFHFFAGGVATFVPTDHYKAGLACTGGGLVGGILGELMMRGFGRILSLVILCPCLFVFALLMFGITPRTLWVTIAYEIKMSRERAEARRLEKESFAEEDEVPHTWKKPEVPPYSGEQQPLSYTDNTGDMEKTPVFGKRKKKNFDVDVAVDDPEAEPVASEETAENVIDEQIFDEVLRRSQENIGQNAVDENEDVPWDEVIPAERKPGDVMDNEALSGMNDDVLDLSKIFSESTDEELLARCLTIASCAA